MRIVKLAALVNVLWCLFAFSEEMPDRVLYTAMMPGAPVIDKNREVLYYMDLVFDVAPADYWIYYSRNRQKLVLDIYGVYILGRPVIDLTGRGVFKSVEVENRETKLSLSRKQSHILMEIVPDPAWHFMATTIDSRTIRVSAWKDIGGMAQVEARKNRAGWVFVLTLFVGSLTLIGIAVFRQ